MNWSVLGALFLGYTVGNLPDSGPVWLSIKLVFTVVMLVLAVRLARREARIADVRRLTLGPGDAIAVKVSKSVPPEVADIIRGDLRKAMLDPDLPVLICDPSVDVEIVGRSSAARPPVRPGGNLQ